MNGDMHCPFKLHVRFSGYDICRALVSSGELPQISPVRLSMDQAQASPAWYLQGIADADCPKWHHLQLWG